MNSHHLRRSRFGLFLFSLVLLISPLRGATITIDYSHDTTNFFNDIVAARNAIDAAAADVSSFLTSTLGAMANDYDGTFQTATVEFDWEFAYSNPFTGDPVEGILPSSIGSSEFRIYAGMQSFSGPKLGQGGPGAFSFGLGASFIDESDIGPALDNAAANSDASMLRGFTAHRSASGDLAGNPYTVSLGPTLGTIAMTWDIDDSGSRNTDPELEAFWHFDHTTPVEAGKVDFYTVALHEIIHAMGFGTVSAWVDLVDGTNWLGPAVIALLGSGEDVLNADGVHAANGILTLNQFGEMQESVMVASITSGTRRTLTELDAAFLTDIGWTLTAVPEPALIPLLLGAALLVVYQVRRRRANAATAAA